MALKLPMLLMKRFESLSWTYLCNLRSDLFVLTMVIGHEFIDSDIYQLILHVLHFKFVQPGR